MQKLSKNQTAKSNQKGNVTNNIEGLNLSANVLDKLNKTEIKNSAKVNKSLYIKGNLNKSERSKFRRLLTAYSNDIIIAAKRLNVTKTAANLDLFNTAKSNFIKFAKETYLNFDEKNAKVEQIYNYNDKERIEHLNLTLELIK